jgi:hypothetical protein
MTRSRGLGFCNSFYKNFCRGSHYVSFCPAGEGGAEKEGFETRAGTLAPFFNRKACTPGEILYNERVANEPRM